MALSRRRFLATTAGATAAVSFARQTPNLWLQAAEQAQRADRSDNILVVVQLSGGNDGLNTITPYDDDDYRKNRLTLAHSPNAVHKINDRIGFHPSMKEMSTLLEDGQLTVIQGVGYPKPNRSHFESMDLWHTAHQIDQSPRVGWLGQFGDAHRTLTPALHLGNEQQPLALAAASAHGLSIRNAETFRLQGNDQWKATVQAAAKHERKTANDLLSFADASLKTTLKTAQRIEQAEKQKGGDASYPGSGLAQRLKRIAHLIDAELGARVFYVTLDGFDTHANQENAHAILLNELSGALGAFSRDLAQRNQQHRVLTMVFSEFGRRVKENASHGTDHGAAAPLFLAGGKLKEGVIGEHPSLTDLDDGDLKYNIDYRRIYASILQDWLGANSEAILGQRFEKLPLFA